LISQGPRDTLKLYYRQGKTYSKTPRGVDKACDQSVETTRDGIHEGHFAQGKDNVEHHDTDNRVIDQQTGRPTPSQGGAGTDEETSTDGATNGNHVQMTALHGLVKLIVRVVGVGRAALERRGGEAHAAPEAERVVVLIVDKVALDGADAGLAGLVDWRVVDGDLLALGVLLLVVRHDGVACVGEGIKRRING